MSSRRRRTPRGRDLVSNALAAAGIALFAGACRGAPTPAASTYQPIATVDQVMDAIVIPSSQAVFDAVVYANGELVQSPKGDDDWHRLQMQALAVAEAGNLLLVPGRAKDTDEWVRRAVAMREAATLAASAAAARNVEQLLAAGSALYDTCTACHATYVPN